jgi:hypothetical protein
MPDPTAPPLSPTAQAVWKAFEMAECDPYLVDPRQAGLAAALRAAVDQVVPEEPAYMRDAGMGPDAYDRSEQIRHEFLAIANELYPQP